MYLGASGGRWPAVVSNPDYPSSSEGLLRLGYVNGDSDFRVTDPFGVYTEDEDTIPLLTLFDPVLGGRKCNL